MKKVIQSIRIAAIIIGCSMIFLGVFLNCFNNLNEIIIQSEFESFDKTLIIRTLYGLVTPFYQGTVIIILALIINPYKVVPLLDKKEVTDIQVEINDNKDE